MKQIFKISAKDTKVHKTINQHSFPNYGSAEAAIQDLPNGVYSIEKFFINEPEISVVTQHSWLVNGKLIVNDEGNLFEAFIPFTSKEIEAFKAYLKPRLIVFKNPLNDNN
ncbi:MAG: hypothetical protein ACRC8Z_16535 [Empedobacter falsenii]